MVDGIAMALTSLKAASEAAKALLELRDAARIGETTIELQGKIAAAQQLTLAAQQEQSALIAEIDALKKQIVQFENWDRESKRYELHDYGNGRLVYSLKGGVEPPEPAHQICANCYQHRQKSILQREMWNPGRADVLSCHRCGSAVYISGHPSEHHAGYRRGVRK